ncbi:MAG: acetolactate synthase, large subunit, biosynthetic type, partial [Clostridiales bacterium]|nr:acetolactate synthase, large subunit, biosynthetic type [Clostridiales bacterium]
KLILKEVLKYLKSSSNQGWKELLQEQARLHPAKKWDEGNEAFVSPKYLLSLLREYAGDDAIVTTEVGQNQIWTANNLKVHLPGTFISSGGLGTMGYGLPSAVGAKLGRPDKTVFVISGDGSFQMSMQELGTMKQYDLGIKMIVFNNSRLGMVRELQKARHGGRYSQVFLEKNPDFIKIVEAYGFKGKKIHGNPEVRAAIEEILADDGSFLLECIVDPDESTL